MTAVVNLSTNVMTGCQICSQPVGGEHFQDSINHYLTKHGYSLLHVGSETIHGPDGKPWHTTVAVLGTKEKSPAGAGLGSGNLRF
jgi:hypothetical protein